MVDNQNHNILKDIQIFYKTKRELDRLCGQDQISHQGLIAEIEHLDTLSLKDYLNKEKDNNDITLVILEEVTDPRNIGSIIRSASAFNINGLIVRERDFPETSKLMYKAASGGMEHLNIFVVSNINSTLKTLREKNFWIYGFDGDGDKELSDIKWEGNNVLVFGSEGYPEPRSIFNSCDSSSIAESLITLAMMLAAATTSSLESILCSE